jgi:hypothetical protein
MKSDSGHRSEGARSENENQKCEADQNGTSKIAKRSQVAGRKHHENHAGDQTDAGDHFQASLRVRHRRDQIDTR